MSEILMQREQFVHRYTVVNGVDTTAMKAVFNLDPANRQFGASANKGTAPVDGSCRICGAEEFLASRVR